MLLGIGDDAAVTKIPDGQYLVTTTDTILEGVHFLPSASADCVAHKSMATNLSDLAAMGAEPSWINLSLSMPDLDKQWLSEFSDTIHKMCEYYSVQLIGGDTVRGPLAVTITAQGFVPKDSYLTRAGAQKGDWLYVTGTLGDASAGLYVLKDKLACSDAKDRDYLASRHLKPQPRVLAGTALRRLASSCLDVSDGLLQDLQHILDASEVGAVINLDAIPLSSSLGNTVPDLEQALVHSCFGGDDYELLFTVSEEQRTSIETAMASYNVACTCIGQITGAVGKQELRLSEKSFSFPEDVVKGFQHF